MLHGYFGYKLATILYQDGSYSDGRIKQRNPFKNLSFSTRWHRKPKKDKVKGKNAILNCLE